MFNPVVLPHSRVAAAFRWMPWVIIAFVVPEFTCRVVGSVPVAPLSSATVTGVLALQVTDAVAVAFTAFVNTEVVENAMLVAVVVH